MLSFFSYKSLTMNELIFKFFVAFNIVASVCCFVYKNNLGGYSVILNDSNDIVAVVKSCRIGLLM